MILDSFLKRAGVCALIIVWGFGTPVLAQTANGGRSAFDFLKISPVSRAVGVAEAYTALGDDVGAICYNPAGLASVLTNELNVTYLSLYQGMDYEFLAFACPLGASFQSLDGTVAISANLLQPGNMQRTNDQGVTVGTFSSGDSIFTLAYARQFSPSFHVGIAAKLIQQQIDTVQTSLFDMDAGVVILPPFQGMRVGISMKNLGSQESGFDLPFVLNTGISYRRYELFSEQDDGVITAEANFPIRPIEDNVGVKVGIEYNYKWVGNRLTVRGGYEFLDKSLNNAGLVLGAGYGIDLSGAVLFLDYAYAPEDIFGEAHRISLTTKF